MGNKDFIKAILERQGKVHFGRVRLLPHHLHLSRQQEQALVQLCFVIVLLRAIPFHRSVISFYCYAWLDCWYSGNACLCLIPCTSHCWTMLRKQAVYHLLTIPSQLQWPCRSG